MSRLKVAGLMSGSSLDGVDVAFCEFFRQEGQWKFELLKAVTLEYPDPWTEMLTKAAEMTGLSLLMLHKDYGHYLGMLVKKLMAETGIVPDFIASHGHTLFHQPGKGLTFQLGEGSSLASAAEIPVVFDFRTKDVALGGEGAPLVPIGDALLFSGFEYCLNLGGFANISYEAENKRIAHDISPCNLGLNHLAARLGCAYDKEGQFARQGTIVVPILEALNRLPFYAANPPKSLGKEWFRDEFLPIIDQEPGNTHDLLRTVTEHVALQVAASVKTNLKGKMLVTGGGAHNNFLTERIQRLTSLDVVVPDAALVDFKEAIVFAFLGVLRWTGEINVLSSVTGARKDHCGGLISL